VRSAHHVLAAVATVAVLTLAGVGLWQAGQDRPRTLEQRTETLAAELRCPTCQAQSAAMSRSEIAAAMRAEIREQLAAGRAPDQVRAWFAARYGPTVLLEPPRSGMGLALWLVPGALLGIGLGLTGVIVRRRAPAQAADAASRAADGRGLRRVVPAAAVVLVAAGVAAWLVVDGAEPSGVSPAPVQAAASSAAVGRDERAVADDPTDPDTWMALGATLEAERAYGPSAEAYRKAAELRPQDVRAPVRLGLVLLKAGQPAGAESVARQILAGRPGHAEGLLVLGLAQRALDLPAARETLQRFLDRAPAHPAAAEVRRLITGP
jgi:cytochrome c-type biogenesis protein CcmH